MHSPCLRGRTNRVQMLPSNQRFYQLSVRVLAGIENCNGAFWWRVECVNQRVCFILFVLLNWLQGRTKGGVVGEGGGGRVGRGEGGGLE